MADKVTIKNTIENVSKQRRQSVLLAKFWKIYWFFFSKLFYDEILPMPNSWCSGYHLLTGDKMSSVKIFAFDICKKIRANMRFRTPLI